MNSAQIDHRATPYLPREAVIVERIQESDTVFTLRLAPRSNDANQSWAFAPGQFNMVSLFGVGEIAISIVTDPQDDAVLAHTIRVVGRVTRALSQLQAGDSVGLRGPFGRGWPTERVAGRDVLVITGGLGCAPAVSVIRHLLHRRNCCEQLTIMQGVKHPDDLIWREQYHQWQQQPNTRVLLAADVPTKDWLGHTGLVTALFDEAQLRPDNSIVMMCGPEPMMRGSALELLKRGFREHDIWLSMERNMQCAVGHCGHCQIGPNFVCKDGPVFPYPVIKPFLAVQGF